MSHAQDGAGETLFAHDEVDGRLRTETAPEGLVSLHSGLVLELVRSDGEFDLYRGHSSGEPFLARGITGDPPSPHHVECLTREFALALFSTRSGPRDRWRSRVTTVGRCCCLRIAAGSNWT